MKPYTRAFASYMIAILCLACTPAPTPVVDLYVTQVDGTGTRFVVTMEVHSPVDIDAIAFGLRGPLGLLPNEISFGGCAETGLFVDEYAVVGCAQHADLGETVAVTDPTFPLTYIIPEFQPDTIAVVLQGGIVDYDSEMVLNNGTVGEIITLGVIEYAIVADPPQDPPLVVLTGINEIPGFEDGPLRIVEEISGLISCGTVGLISSSNYSSDSDGDGRGDNADNCLLTYNPGQIDTDQDGLGDACDDES